MGERRNAASLFSHSLKTPLSSVKVGAQLLLKHLTGKVSDKDQQLLEVLFRNATTLEVRINQLIELAQIGEDGLELNLSVDQLEVIHSLKENEAAPQPEPVRREEADFTDSSLKSHSAEAPEEVSASKIVVHADPEIADLIPKFLENRIKDIAAIREALERSDFETIRTLGHMMKGAGGGFGFHGITEIGKTLEDSAKASNAEEIQKGVEALAVYMNTVEVVYDEL